MNIRNWNLCAIVIATLLLAGCQETKQTTTTDTNTDGPDRGDTTEPDEVGGSGVGGGAPDLDLQDEPTTDEPEPEPVPDEPTPEPEPEEPKPEPTTDEPKPEPAPDVPEPAADSPEPAATETSATESVTTGDWVMWGGAASRNMVNSTTGVTTNFVPGKNENVLLKFLVGKDAISFEDAVAGTELSASSVEKAGKVLAKAKMIDFVVERNKETREKIYSPLKINDAGTDASTRLLWTATLGSQTYGNPVVAGGNRNQRDGIRHNG